jgi:hypothetical protein
MKRSPKSRRRLKKKPGKNKQQRELIPRMREHLQSLGHSDVKSYLKWCKQNGFRRDVNKSHMEMWAEKDLVNEIWADEHLKRRKKVKNIPDQILQMSRGERKVAKYDAPLLKKLSQTIRRNRPRGHQKEFEIRFLHHVALNSKLLEREEYVGAVAGLVAHQHQWIRDYGQWKAKSHNVDKQFVSLVHHLFAHYPVPEFLSLQFAHGEKTAKSLFIHLGAGRSLRTFNKLKVDLTKKMAHYFMQAPADCTVNEAIRWGQTVSMGGSKMLANAVRAGLSGISSCDHPFWLSVIRFFIAHPSLKPGEFGPVADYIHAVKFESPRIIAPGGNVVFRDPEKPNFSMKDRNPETLKALVEKWHRQLAKASKYQNLKWEPSGIRDAIIQEGRAEAKNCKIWKFVELLTSRELYAEGRSLGHCVATYARDCSMGKSSIWSLYCNDARLLTLEVNPSRRALVQIRGKYNRPATQKERKIIRQWAGMNGLAMAQYA